MLERRLFLHLDWLLIGAIFCLSVIGVAMIFSTTGSWRLPAVVPKSSTYSSIPSSAR